jgi:hypothetical protein
VLSTTEQPEERTRERRWSRRRLMASGRRRASTRLGERHRTTRRSCENRNNKAQVERETAENFSCLLLQRPGEFVFEVETSITRKPQTRLLFAIFTFRNSRSLNREDIRGCRKTNKLFFVSLNKCRKTRDVKSGRYTFHARARSRR